MTEGKRSFQNMHFLFSKNHFDIFLIFIFWILTVFRL